MFSFYRIFVFSIVLLAFGIFMLERMGGGREILKNSNSELKFILSDKEKIDRLRLELQSFIKTPMMRIDGIEVFSGEAGFNELLNPPDISFLGLEYCLGHEELFIKFALDDTARLHNKGVVEIGIGCFRSHLVFEVRLNGSLSVSPNLRPLVAENS